MAEERPARNRQVRDYRIYLDSDKLIQDIRLDLQDVNKTIRILEKRESKNKDTIEKIQGYRAKLRKSWKLSDYKRNVNELNRLARDYALNPTIEGARALKSAAQELEDNVLVVHSIRVAQAGAVLTDPSAQSNFYSRAAVNIANRQVSRRHYADGTPSILQNTAFRNSVYGYGSKEKAGPARIKVQERDILNTPEKMEQFFTSISNPQVLRDAVAKSSTHTSIVIPSPVSPKPKSKVSGSATGAIILNTPFVSTQSANKVRSVWDSLHANPSTYVSPGAQSLLLGMQAGDGAWERLNTIRFRNLSPAMQAMGEPIKGTHPATGNITGVWSASKFPHKKNQIITEYSYETDLDEAKEKKNKKSLIKSIELLYRPLINLVKGLGDIAAEAKHMELAMSSLASALGNPFDEGTLAAIGDFGGAGASTALGGLGAIGGTISSVGGGIGRMANDTWMMRGKGMEGASASKFGGVFTAISAILGVIGGAISAVVGVISAGFGMANSLLKSINKITLKILSTSPLFEAIKNILNLAFTMAFLPAMTLLQGKLLPIFTGLLKSMTDFGSKFASLFTETRLTLITDAFKGIIGSIVNFFDNNKEQFAEMITQMILVLPAMMKMQLGIIELFVNNKGKIMNLVNKTIDVLNTFIDQGLLNDLLDFIRDVLNFLHDHGVNIARSVIALAKFFVGAADFVSDTTEQHASSLAKYATSTYIKSANHDAFGAIGEAAKGLISHLTFGYVQLASGGYVPATPGGVPAIIGEGGEGEYVIPESKLNSIGGLTVVFSGTVYGMNDFKQQVRSIMNEYTTKANFR